LNLKHHVRSFLSINYFPFFGAVQKKNAERLNFVIDQRKAVSAEVSSTLGMAWPAPHRVNNPTLSTPAPFGHYDGPAVKQKQNKLFLGEPWSGIIEIHKKLIKMIF